MLNGKQRKVLKMLGEGVSQREAAQRLGLNRWSLWIWRNRNKEFGEAMGRIVGKEEKQGERRKKRVKHPLLERLRLACLIAAMTEMKQRLKTPKIEGTETKELLAIIEKVGRVGEKRPKKQGAEGAETGTEETMIGRMSDETRKRLYEIIVGESEGAEGDSAQG